MDKGAYYGGYKGGATKIECNLLDIASLNEAVQMIRGAAKNIQNAKGALLEEICKTGADICREKITELGAVDSGELIGSVGYETKDDFGVIYADAGHAAYVEYGTGVVGQGTYTGQLPAGWQYDVNGHGDSGWTYIKDGVRHWTKGQTARPFMYETAKQLQNIDLKKCAKRVIESELQK